MIYELMFTFYILLLFDAPSGAGQKTTKTGPAAGFACGRSGFYLMQRPIFCTASRNGRGNVIE
ncbi:hypothetical protein D3Z39_06685 [Anaerotruncus colihominis]|uniref:Uncharacterized protein n=1 Tax=Anaerotruncus colihominis TaxID=169435 RepID=A0A845RI98_9FIRM|nr:hypothetical protein [Anaerotruncus colihominis]